jgi:serine protease Do
VLKVDGKNLPALTLADSDKLEVGDTVLAIGNPLGVGQTVTSGIVSALGRNGFGIAGYENFIQTDAAINPGNSGGALVDAEGRLIGINSAIISRTGGYQGIGFAIPINMARYVMDRLTREGRVTRGYLGVGLQPLTKELAGAFELTDPASGALVNEVAPETPAEKAGFREGDVVTEFNGRKVSDSANLKLMIAETSPGTHVNVKVLRSDLGKKPGEKSISATLDELPQDQPARAAEQRDNRQSIEPKSGGLNGLEVSDLDARTRRRLGAPANLRGALVIGLEQNSSASEAGLQQYDIILEINRQPVRSATEAVALGKKAGNDRVLLRVWTAGEEGSPGAAHYIAIKSARES